MITIRKVERMARCGRGVLVAGLVATAFLAGSIWAAPEGEQVVRGDVGFKRSGNLTLIEAGNNSIINYRSFDILAPETVRFIQPSSRSRGLNRVKSFDATRIDGSLLANGRVYITNPAGVYFGHGSLVNVGAIYAAAGTISNEDFLGGLTVLRI